MLTAIKGVYENGIIKPLEEINIGGKMEVTITFLDTQKDRKTPFLSAVGSWKYVDTERLKEQIYESRKISNRKEVEL